MMCVCDCSDLGGFAAEVVAVRRILRPHSAIFTEFKEQVAIHDGSQSMIADRRILRPRCKCEWGLPQLLIQVV